MALAVRRLLVGQPLHNSRAKHERLTKLVALPVFSSDALSSVAYASEEILMALAAGSVAFGYSLWVGGAIAALLAILTVSYRQTIFAYPSGGGAYIVASDNLGLKPGTAAGAALLIDYLLTVAVSIASGVAAIDSAFPALRHLRVEICIFCVFFVAVMNLRGVRESGAFFSIPTYAFVLAFFAMIAKGLFLYFTHHVTPLELPAGAHYPTGTIGTLGAFVFVRVVLQAFASGCSALTGVEAISNGVPAFRAPEAKNAADTMRWMAVLLGLMFLGLTFLAKIFGAYPREGETIASQIARATFGRGPAYLVIQAATALILILAANTSFADFPRLSAVLARDRLLPRQFAQIGDRLVFQNGIIVLAGLASLLIAVFHGDVHRLIPLYAVGVFLSFTLSQAGMVKHWLRQGKRWASRNVIINLSGAITTAIALIVIASMKFIHGAYVVVILIPALMYVFFRIHHHYQDMRRQLTVANWDRPVTTKHTVIVLVSGIHRGVVSALDFARLIAADCRALYVELDPQTTPQFYQHWEKWAGGIPLIILDSPYRCLKEPVLRYVDATQGGDPNHVVTVILPEFVPAKRWHHLLHNQSALMLKWALMWRRNVIVTNVRYYLDE